MKVIFTIYCFSLNQAKVLKEKLEKIQINTILMINITENHSSKFTDYQYMLNVLCEVANLKYMEKAIKERIYQVNKLDSYVLVLNAY